jgi:hypothetical protein
VLLTAHRRSVFSAHQNPMQERWGGVGLQVIGQALSIWGISKQPNAESPSIPNATALNFEPHSTARALAARSQSAGFAQCSVLRASPSIECSVLSAQCYGARGVHSMLSAQANSEHCQDTDDAHAASCVVSGGPGPRGMGMAHKHTSKSAREPSHGDMCARTHHACYI